MAILMLRPSNLWGDMVRCMGDDFRIPGRSYIDQIGDSKCPRDTIGGIHRARLSEGC